MKNFLLRKIFLHILSTIFLILFQSSTPFVSTTLASDTETDLAYALLHAVSNENIEKAREIITQGANIDLTCPKMGVCSPLVVATKKGNIEMVKLLIESGADVNIQSGRIRDTPIILALPSPNQEITDLLLNAGADIYKENAFGISAWAGTCLMGEISLIKKLIKYGAKINKSVGYGQTRNITCLMFVAQSGHLDSVKFILKSGGEIDAKDSKDQTSLAYSLREKPKTPEMKKNKFEIFKLLLESRLRSNLSKGLVLKEWLMIGYQEYGKYTKALIDSGVDVNSKINHHGTHNITPLMIYTTTGNMDSINLLLEAGADRTAKDSNGLTAQDYAKKLGKQKVVDLLE